MGFSYANEGMLADYGGHGMTHLDANGNPVYAYRDADYGTLQNELARTDYERKRAGQGLANAEDDYRFSQQSRDRMGGNLEEMRQAALGNGPSVASDQMSAGLRSGQAGMQAQAASGRGMYGVAQGARNAAVANSGMAVDTAASQGILRAQEAARARGEYLAGSQQMRADDAAMQKSAVQYANQGNATDLNWFQQRQGILQSQLDAQKARMGNNMRSQMSHEAANAQANHDATAGGIGAVEGMAAMGSDRRMKKNIADASSAAGKMEADIVKQLSVQGPSTGYDYGPQGPAGNNGSWYERDDDGQVREYGQPMPRASMGMGSVNDSELAAMSQAMGPQKGLAHKFMDTLAPKSYQYKDPNDAWNKQPGTHLGVIAQNVEQAPGVGKQIVADTPNGKKLRLPELLSADTAAIGDLHQRLKAMEMGAMRKDDYGHLAAMSAAARKGGY